MSDDEELDRRQFFKRAGMLGAAVAGGAQFLAGCDRGGGGGSGGGKASADKQKQKTGGSGGQKGGSKDKGGGSEELSCTDTSGLSDSDIKTRKSLNYVDKSEKEGENCANCRLYEKPKNEGECGGCSVVPGPIHPDGWCSSWQKMKG